MGEGERARSLWAQQTTFDKLKGQAPRTAACSLGGAWGPWEEFSPKENQATIVGRMAKGPLLHEDCPVTKTKPWAVGDGGG